MIYFPAKKKTFYITTPIYYVNANPHLGTAYSTIVADILARWHRLKGEDVFFLTGLDENSQKNVEAAKKIGEKDIQKYLNDMAKIWKGTWEKLGLSNNNFIRTTEKRHKEAVLKFFNKVLKNGDIYKGTYEGFYCQDCEAFVPKSDLVNGLCPIHKKPPQLLKEKNYFFRASKYKQQILDHIKNNQEFIQPESRRNEIVSYIEDAFDNISISRQSIKWGISLPVDNSQVFYVWFDALINYLTAIGYVDDRKKFKKYWPADLHIVGKDIIKFHCALWPAMLLSARIPLPKKVFAHGFFTVNGEKISKSLGNAIDPLGLLEKYPLDSLRYFFVKEIVFGEDGDFSEQSLINRINGELVNDLGNLVYRSLTLAERYNGKIFGKKELEEKLNLIKIEKSFDELKIHEALEEIWNFIRATNKYINENEPWKLEGEKLSNVIYNLVESIRIISILISPILPDTSRKINEQLGVKAGNLDDCKFKKFAGKIKKGEYLFKKVE